jgi:hypothetical protein
VAFAITWKYAFNKRVCGRYLKNQVTEQSAATDLTAKKKIYKQEGNCRNCVKSSVD